MIKEQVTTEILNKMQLLLDNDQLIQLKDTVYIVLCQYDITPQKELPREVDDNWIFVLHEYLSAKAFEGKSEGTIKQYKYELGHLLSYINTDISKITSSNILEYLQNYKKIHNVGNQYLENKRLVYSAFFTWLHKKGKIPANPMVNINRFKIEEKIKKPFTDEERELLLLNANTIRDKAIMEFLYSTCVRVSELVSIDITDIRFVERDLVVYGKGAKERIVYINPRSNVYLQMYLRSRTDDNPALFVSTKKPHTRLTKSGIESMIRETGRRAGVEKAHPHKFRRTGATNASNRGMPIEEVAVMLGHKKLETTKMYCSIKQQSVKYHHDKYLSA